MAATTTKPPVKRGLWSVVHCDTPADVLTGAKEVRLTFTDGREAIFGTVVRFQPVHPSFVVVRPWGTATTLSIRLAHLTSVAVPTSMKWEAVRAIGEDQRRRLGR